MNPITKIQILLTATIVEFAVASVAGTFGALVIFWVAVVMFLATVAILVDVVSRRRDREALRLRHGWVSVADRNVVRSDDSLRAYLGDNATVARTGRRGVHVLCCGFPLPVRYWLPVSRKHLARSWPDLVAFLNAVGFFTTDQFLQGAQRVVAMTVPGQAPRAFELIREKRPVSAGPSVSAEPVVPVLPPELADPAWADARVRWDEERAPFRARLGRAKLALEKHEKCAHRESVQPLLREAEAEYSGALRLYVNRFGEKPDEPSDNPVLTVFRPVRASADCPRGHCAVHAIVSSDAERGVLRECTYCSPVSRWFEKQED